MSSLTLRHAILLALAPATLISHTATAATGDDLPVVELDPVVVTVSRSATPLSDTPASVTVISAGEIEKNPARNLSDVIQSDAGIYVKQSGGIGQIPEVSIRGSLPKHTLFLKDGARLNTQNELNPAFPGFFDTTDVERIEIVKGPASVQHGTDAIGGVIQMVSKTPTRTGGEVTGIIGENNTYKAIVRGDVVHNGFYASLSGQRLESDGTRIFNNQSRKDKAGYDQKGYAAKLGYNNDVLNTSVQISENEGVNIFSSNSGITNAAAREFDNRVINAQAALKHHNDFTTSIRFSDTQDNQNLPVYGSKYDSAGQEIDLNTKWAFAPNHNILIGATGSRSEFQSNTITDGKQEVDTIGYYLQHQYNSDKVNTQVGVRLEDHERFGNHTVGQGAVRYHITPATSVYANVGSAFRAPTLNELYSQWGGNTELQPEESVSYEIGLTKTINDNTTVQLSGFQSTINQLIDSTCIDVCDGDWKTTFPVYQNINIEGKTKFTGGELGIKFNQGDYYASANYGYVETEVKQTGLEIAYRPKHTVTLTLGYDDGIVGVSTSVIARSDAYANEDNTIKVPGYTTVDVDAHWNINPYVKLFTNIQNIGNVEYKTANYSGNQWYVNGGRQANLGVTFKY